MLAVKVLLAVVVAPAVLFGAFAWVAYGFDRLWRTVVQGWGGGSLSTNATGRRPDKPYDRDVDEYLDWLDREAEEYLVWLDRESHEYLDWLDSLPEVGR